MMTDTTNPPVVFTDNVQVPLTFEELLLTDPRRLEDLRTNGVLSKPQLIYVDRLLAVAETKPKLIWCHETLTAGCGALASRIVIPFNDGKPSFGAVRYVCGSEECLESVVRRSRLPNEVYEFSCAGLREFIAKHPDHVEAGRFSRCLAKGWGLLAPGAHYSSKGLIAFFGVQSQLASDGTGMEQRDNA